MRNVISLSCTLRKNKSTLAEQALRYIQLLYEIESEVAIWGRIYDSEYGKKKLYG